MLYLTLFTVSLLAATLLPGGSEALLLYDLSSGANSVLLLISATAGNVLGSVINYVTGKKGIEYLVEKRYAKERDLAKAHRIFEKYGAVALLFSWMPVVGDPITFIAGVSGYDFRRFLLLVLLAKGVRYGVLVSCSPFFFK